MKSDDWQQNFEGLNTIKTIAMFHKSLLSHKQKTVSKQVFQCIVAQMDNLRSQVAKNANMTLATVFENLNAKDLDLHIESVVPMLIKKSTDTN